VGHGARANAAREVAERIGAPLSDEQELALLVVTGYPRAPGARLVQRPREELAFHNALQQLARLLDQTPGIGRPFKAGTTMPAEWGRSRPA
jgi:hypothetical protein